jgi:ubiquinone biosynthesis protein COQ4
LGYIYAATLKKTGFDPNLHAGMTADSDAKYVELRLSQTHDLWHIVTGFDTSAIGEIGLQAFHLPQFPYPLAAMLVANSLMSSTLLAPEELPTLLEAIAQGWQMGATANPLFAQKWEEAWDKPLAQWQAELNIQPVQHH